MDIGENSTDATVLFARANGNSVDVNKNIIDNGAPNYSGARGNFGISGYVLSIWLFRIILSLCYPIDISRISENVISRIVHCAARFSWIIHDRTRSRGWSFNINRAPDD